MCLTLHLSDSLSTETAACQASLSFTISQSLLRLVSIESVMLSNHVILCYLLLPSVFPSIRVFSNELTLYSGGQSVGASASASVLPMNIQGWFPLGFDWFDLFTIQGTLKSLLQHFLVIILPCNQVNCLNTHIPKLVANPVLCSLSAHPPTKLYSGTPGAYYVWIGES